MATSNNRPQLLVGRMLNYSYIGAELAMLPVFMSEIAPSNSRGFWVGTYHLALVGGSFVVQLIIRGCQDLPGSWPWRLPFILMIVRRSPLLA